ncbi:hypothetical protein [Undibacterium sp. Ji49W]|uniref:hypothetical protein n=1 Tax=Undibacterium sp. Ji49W TaxID=3413040 RepID=UPI003BEF7242
MNSTVIFDVTQAGYKSYLFPAVGLIAVATGLYYLYLHFSNHPRKLPVVTILLGKPPLWFSCVFFGFACLWTTIAFKSTYSDYKELRSAFELGQCKLVDGEVENFQTNVKERGQDEESFDVGDAHFSYSSNIINAGYNTTTYQGGQLREGLHVRIHRCALGIARIEIVEDATMKN